MNADTRQLVQRPLYSIPSAKTLQMVAAAGAVETGARPNRVNSPFLLWSRVYIICGNEASSLNNWVFYCGLWYTEAGASSLNTMVVYFGLWYPLERARALTILVFYFGIQRRGLMI